MGNFEDEPIDESELSPYIQEGIQMKDLINLKKAFLSLDTNKDGLIEYDINKLDDINKFDLPVQEPNGKTILNFKQFMEIMIDNIKRSDSKNENYIMANGGLSNDQGMEYIHKILHKPQKPDLFELSSPRWKKNEYEFKVPGPAYYHPRNQPKTLSFNRNNIDFIVTPGVCNEQDDDPIYDS